MVNAALSERARELWKERGEAVRRLDSPARIEERQAPVRERFIEALGGFPERTPLHARITRTLERDDYRVEMLVYESLPGFRVTANVYVPRRRDPPYPAVLGVAGHSDNGKASATYQRAWISMAKRGFLVLAYDPPGQGERSLYFDPELGRSRVGIGTREHARWTTSSPGQTSIPRGWRRPATRGAAPRPPTSPSSSRGSRSPSPPAT